jgi:U32 family peptidase
MLVSAGSDEVSNACSHSPPQSKPDGTLWLTWCEMCAIHAMRHHPVIHLEIFVPASSPFIPELLAPAGGPEALRAAVANGADAVYLGVEVLNARRGAKNFALTELADACDFAHLRGVRVYLTLNVVVLPDELDSALQVVDAAWAAGVDAVIVQDLGLLRVIRMAMPHVRIHSSTQMNAHNTATIEALAALGVSRVTLAREVSIDEIAVFAGAGLVEVECFVHGALCLCYSGQCLMSSLIGRRSANRGMCAQPCRLPYELIDTEHGSLATPGAHLLSPKDLAGLAVLPELLKAGISALKIEGRMKSPEYVALVTRVYRAALDRAAADPERFEVREGERSVLAESFSRGFSEAYLVGERGNDMMSYSRPNNRGVPVGRVVEVRGGRASIALDASLESADTIEFWTSAGRFAQVAGELTQDTANRDTAPAGVRVQIDVAEPVSAGDRVFRVRNAALLSAAQRTFAEANGARPIPLDFDAHVVVGEPLRVMVRDGRGRAGTAQATLVERARTKAVTAEEIAEHVGRLGGTPYTIASWSLELSGDAGIGFSALHQVRRQALADYESAVLAPWSDRQLAHTVLPSTPTVRRRRVTTPRVVVAVADEASASACLASGADAALVSTLSLGAPHAIRNGIVPVLGRIAHDREVDAMLRWAVPGARVTAGNLGLVRPASLAGAVVEADWPLNAVNQQAVAQLAELGASFVWLSPELSGRQIAEVAGRSPLDVGVTVLGRQELMVTEHCVLMAEGDCTRSCATCERRAQPRLLRDRKGYEFPVVTDVSGRSHIFNSVTLDLSAVIPDILSAGVSALRLDLELETPDDAARHTRDFRQLLERLAVGVAPPAREKGAQTTSGHYFRGVV